MTIYLEGTICAVAVGRGKKVRDRRTERQISEQPLKFESTIVCIYVCMYVRIYACIYVCIYASLGLIF
jgi:hypothetical protein